MANTPVKKQSMANFMSLPSTSKFLQDTLNEKKGEFVSNMIALTESDTGLSECDPQQLMKCAMNATALNLPLNKNLGYAYVIAYKNNKKGIQEPQFQIGAKGFKQLAMRSNHYETMNHCEIREGELNINKFTGEFKFNEENPTGKIVGYFAFFRLLNGYTKSLYMSNEKLEAHALKYVPLYRSDKNKGTKYSKWSTDERGAMCLKTVIKLLLSREGMLSTDMAKAMDYDNSDEPATVNNRSIQDAEIVEQKDNSQPAKVVV